MALGIALTWATFAEDNFLTMATPRTAWQIYDALWMLCAPFFRGPRHMMASSWFGSMKPDKAVEESARKCNGY
eukprot:5814905-Amphidinium_carterae.1